jgi:hypothetical protein
MNYVHVHTMAGVHKFSKNLQAISKPRCLKSDIQEFHNLKFRHCIGVVKHTIWKYLKYVCHLTHSWKLWTLEMHRPHVFWRLYTLKSRLLLWKEWNMTFSVCQNLLHDIKCMCILQLAYQADIYPQPGGRPRIHLYQLMGRSTILRLRHIVLLVSCPSCRKWCKIWWPGTWSMKHWSMFPISITICLQTRQVHRNCNAPCDYTHTWSSGKQ